MFVSPASFLRTLTTAGTAALLLGTAGAQNAYPDYKSTLRGRSSAKYYYDVRESGKQIVAVQVRHGSYVDNMRVALQNRGRTGSVTWTPWFGPSTGGGVTTFHVPHGDYLSSMKTGWKNNYNNSPSRYHLAKLVLRTKGGKTQTFGKTYSGSHGKIEYDMNPPAGHEIVGFYGTADRYVLGMGAYHRMANTEASAEYPNRTGNDDFVNYTARSRSGRPDYIWRISAKVTPLGPYPRAIVGLRFFWRDAGDRKTNSYETPWLGGDGDLEQAIVPGDDYFERVSVSYGIGGNVRFVVALRLQSHRGKVWTLGQQASSWVALETPPSGEAFAFWGKRGKTKAFYSIGVNHRTFRGLVQPLATTCKGAPTLTFSGKPTVDGKANAVKFVMDSHHLPLRLIRIGTKQESKLGGCAFWVNLQESIVMPMGTELPISIPANSSLVGGGLYAQGIALQAGGPIQGMAIASNAVAVILGSEYLD